MYSVIIDYSIQLTHDVAQSGHSSDLNYIPNLMSISIFGDICL